eukprot:411462_1
MATEEALAEGQELQTSRGWHQGDRTAGGDEWVGGWRKEKHVYDGKRMRKPVVRKTVDFNSTLLLHIEERAFRKDSFERPSCFPTVDYVKQILPASEYADNPSNSFCTKYISTSINKSRCPINVVCWTPEGRRLMTGAHTGEFTVWNGLTFNFETILQAHDDPVRCMKWSHNDGWMVTSDDRGVIKYWQTNMNNVKAFQGHVGYPIRDISFSPSDLKYVTASDEGLLKIWDFERCKNERNLIGHGWDVKCCDWHPQKGLIISGSKDQMIKLWDPRTGRALVTIHDHKSTVSCIDINKNGNLFLSGSRDQLSKLWDLRKLKEEVQVFKGHKKEVTCMQWHPYHESMFVTGGFDGTLMYWVTGSSEPQAEIFGAHDNSIWDLQWHPLGHILCTGSSDHTTRFWARNRPGDLMDDKYNANQLPLEKRAKALSALKEAASLNPNRFGRFRMPAVLEQWTDQKSVSAQRVKDEDEVIPMMGAAKEISEKVEKKNGPSPVANGTLLINGSGLTVKAEPRTNTTGPPQKKQRLPSGPSGGHPSRTPADSSVGAPSFPPFPMPGMPGMPPFPGPGFPMPPLQPGSPGIPPGPTQLRPSGPGQQRGGGRGQPMSRGMHMPGSQSSRGTHMPGSQSSRGMHMPGSQSSRGIHMPGSQSSRGFRGRQGPGQQVGRGAFVPQQEPGNFDGSYQQQMGTGNGRGEAQHINRGGSHFRGPGGPGRGRGPSRGPGGPGRGRGPSRGPGGLGRGRGNFNNQFQGPRGRGFQGPPSSQFPFAEQFETQEDFPPDDWN